MVQKITLATRFVAKMTIKSITVDPDLKKSTQPKQCVSSIAPPQEPTTDIVEIFLEKAIKKKKSIHSGCLAQQNSKNKQNSPKTQANLEPDSDDLYWAETLDSHPAQDHQNRTHQDTFTKQYLSENLPSAPDLQPFYTVQEAVDLSNRVVQSGKPNYDGLRVEVKSGMNIPAWRFLLKGYKMRRRL